MNKEQSGFLNVSADVAGYIKQISQKNTFLRTAENSRTIIKLKGNWNVLLQNQLCYCFSRFMEIKT